MSIAPASVKRPTHGGKRKGAGRPVTSKRTARLVVRVEPALLKAASDAVGGGKALADVVRGYLRRLGRATASATAESPKRGSGDQ